LSISCTTRAPREGEVDGKDYFFVSREEFEKMIRDKEMIEYAEYAGNYYGTPRKEAEEVLASGKNLILEIEVDGAMQIKKKFPEAVLIMLLPPTYAEQEKRLRGRGTETEDKILARLAQAKVEVQLLPEYDYVVYNLDGGAEECAKQIHAIVYAEQFRTSRDPDAIPRFFGEL
jgi:guanylate kinase